MHTRIDRSPTSLLPVCTCGWRGVTVTTPAAAHRQTVAHEAETHPTSHRARDAAARATRRHADRDANVFDLRTM
jgi:hypothetical protein